MPDETEALRAARLNWAAGGSRDVAHVAVTGVVYLLLAMPLARPVAALGGAVSIGLPAGMALVALLVWGLRCWPGVWLAALLVPLLLQPTTPDLVPAVAAATAATVQAVLGAILTRRLTGVPEPLVDPLHVAGFLLLGGPVACGVGSVVAVVPLLNADSSGWAELASAWLGLWSRDSLGVLLLAPVLLFVWPGSPMASARLAGTVALPALLTAAVLVVGQVGVVRLLQERQLAERQGRLDESFEMGVATLPSQVSRLQAVAGLFAASGAVSERQFEVFGKGLLARSMIASLQWAPRVAAADRDEFVAKVRAAGRADYRLFEWDGRGHPQPLRPREDSFPVEYSLGVESALSSPGLDYAFDSLAAAAMARARDSGRVQMTRRPLQAAGGRRMLLAFVPVYASGLDALDPGLEPRSEALRGFVVGGFELQSLFESLRTLASERGFGFRVSDITEAGAPVVLEDTLVGVAASGWSRELEIGGQLWRITLGERNDNAVAADDSLYIYRLMSVAVGFFAAMAILGAAGRSVATAAEVERRTDELGEVMALQARDHELLRAEVDERRQAEAERDQLFDLSLDLLCTFDRQSGRLQRCNPAFSSTLGWTEIELTSRPMIEFVHPDDREATELAIRMQLSQGGRYRAFRHRFAHKDRSWRVLSWKYAAAPSGLLVATGRDVTEEQAMTAQLHRAKVGAEEENRAKSAFLAMMSHEIRTPMNGVVGMAEVLNQTRLTSHQRQLVDTMTQSANALLTLIDDILDFSKIEAGRLELELEPVCIGDIVEGVCELLVPGAQAKSVVVTHFVDPELPERVLADATRLRQILNNLIGNAIKFSGGREGCTGHVAVRAVVTRSKPLSVAFSVADNGIGIDSKQQTLLFAPFTQAEASTTRRFGGTGLGLAICRRLVDMMQGDIRLDSELGHGATFTVTLPFKMADEQPARDWCDLSGVKCLIVPGPVFAAEDLQAYIRHVGAEVEVVADLAAAGRRALEWGAHVVVHDAEGQTAAVDDLRAEFAQAAQVHHVALTRGRRRQPRVATDDIITIDLDRMRRAAFLDAVAVAAGRASPTPYVYRGHHVPTTLAPASNTDGNVADIAGVECIVVADAAIDLQPLQEALEAGGARVRLVPDLYAAATEAASLAGQPVVIHDARSDRVSFDDLNTLFARVPSARHLAVTRGNRTHARISVQEAVTLDAAALKTSTLIDAVAVAAGRASPAVFDKAVRDGDDWIEGPSVADARQQGQLILVAEDDKTNQKVISTQLRLLGHAAEIANDGLEALEKWRNGSYALLLADLHMPNLDGYGLSAAIRQEEAGSRRFPILALTANTLRGESQRALQAGMDDYLTKPISLPVLKAALDKWLPEFDSQTPVAVGESATVEKARVDADAPGSVDVTVLQRLVGDDPETVRELLLEYQETLRVRTEELREAWARADCGAVAAAAHALKSSSRSVGAVALGELCAGLEGSGKAGDADAVGDAMGSFEAELAVVETDLADLVERG